DGTSFGLFGGWNKTFTNELLLGVEVAYNEVDLEHDNPRQLTGWGYYSNNVSLERTFAAVSKFGFVHQKTLFYGLAGITSGKFTTNLWSGLDPIEGKGNETSEYKTGYTLGVGIEQLVYKNISIRAEYSYSDFGAISSETNGGLSTYKYTFDHKLSIYKLGLSYNF
ncbi:MAG TPA: outer membrane beta-barrel protein, partial [Flavobacteriaceae bacterium]|nr:outer membrane beta-barrel protein [Flavobacteriaceae bacterium]